jgi:hypothetical protein
LAETTPEVSRKMRKRIAVAALVPDRVGEAAAVLARSFLDNPLLAHTFADERLRDRALRLLFAGLCRDALPFGHVDAAAVDGRMLGLRCGFRLAPIGCPWDDGSASPRRFFGSFRSTLEAPGECSAWMPHRAAFTPRNITGSYRRSEWTGDSGAGHRDAAPCTRRGPRQRREDALLSVHVEPSHLAALQSARVRGHARHPSPSWRSTHVDHVAKAVDPGERFVTSSNLSGW